MSKLSWVKRAGLGLALVGLVGCETTGLSMRESGGRDYSHFVYGLYDKPVGAPEEAPQIRRPARLAVAQVGEVTPPSGMVDALAKETGLFARVEGIPGVLNEAEPVRGCYPGNSQPVNSADMRAQIERMERLARDTGSDYLFIFGGTVDYGDNTTPLSVLDLTIVGAYVVPSHQIDGEARASGAMIDLRTGRVVMLVDATAKGGRLESAAWADGGKVQLVESLRDKIVSQLTARLIAQCKAGPQA